MCEELIEAVKNNDLNLVKRLILQGVDINYQNKEGCTALSYAILKNRTEISEELIKAKANINIQDKTGTTILMKACRVGDIKLVKKLIEIGVNVNIQNQEGKTALILTILNIKNYDNLILIMNKILNVETPLKNYLEIVQILIKAGADLDIQDNSGKTALMYSCIEGITEIALELIKAGANLDLQDNFGRTALMHSCMKKHIRIALELIKAKANLTIQDSDKKIFLSLCSNYDFVYTLIENGVDIELVQDKEDLLITACLTSTLKLVQKLVKIKNGKINLDVKDINGKTPLLIAIEKEDIEIVKELIKAGADVCIRDTKKISILEYGLKSKNNKIKALFTLYKKLLM
jgi:ankyrin repeat protein